MRAAAKQSCREPPYLDVQLDAPAEVRCGILSLAACPMYDKHYHGCNINAGYVQLAAAVLRTPGGSSAERMQPPSSGSLEDAQRLLVMTRDIECKYNLIGFNPHPGTRFRPSPPERVSWTPDLDTGLPAYHICKPYKEAAKSLHPARACCRLVKALSEHCISFHLACVWNP